jgi:hypothetical protein
LATGTNHSDVPLVKTALNELHRELGGDMVPFAGYELPVLYKHPSNENGGVMKEHLWCRSEGKSALFDVSHMGQVCVQKTPNGTDKQTFHDDDNDDVDGWMDGWKKSSVSICVGVSL